MIDNSSNHQVDNENSSSDNSISFMNTENVSSEERNVCLEALSEILDVAGVMDQVSVIDKGLWRAADYIDDQGQLVPHKSVDWYVNKWYESDRGQVRAGKAGDELLYSPKTDLSRWNVVLTDLDLYTPDTNFVVGIAHRGQATIISVNRFRGIGDESLENETKKQEVYHEVGHVFNLPAPGRKDLSRSLGIHCSNLCAMRQGITVPTDWIDFVKDRQKSRQIYCETCRQDLREYFRKQD